MQEEDGTGTQPDLRIVATNTSAAIEKNEATKRLTWALRELTANLLRIVRGAGKPYSLGADLQALINAFHEYRETTGHWPFSDDISAALSIDLGDEWRRMLKGAELSQFYACEHIIRGALQQAASRLVEQKTQERMGETEMLDGVRAFEDAHKEMRKEWEAVHKPARTPKRGRPRRS
jgi:hypothetical protein